MQTGHCPIYNSTLNTFVVSSSTEIYVSKLIEPCLDIAAFPSVHYVHNKLNTAYNGGSLEITLTVLVNYNKIKLLYRNVVSLWSIGLTQYKLQVLLSRNKTQRKIWIQQ